MAFVDYLHTSGTAILRAAGGPRAPQVFVSLMEGAKSHMAKTSSVARVFKPDSQAPTPRKAKHFFPGFIIRFLEEHSFTISAGTVETLAQRIIKACSTYTTDMDALL